MFLLTLLLKRGNCHSGAGSTGTWCIRRREARVSYTLPGVNFCGEENNNLKVSDFHSTSSDELYRWEDVSISISGTEGRLNSEYGSERGEVHLNRLGRLMSRFVLRGSKDGKSASKPETDTRTAITETNTGTPASLNRAHFDFNRSKASEISLTKIATKAVKVAMALGDFSPRAVADIQSYWHCCCSSLRQLSPPQLC